MERNFEKTLLVSVMLGISLALVPSCKPKQTQQETGLFENVDLNLNRNYGELKNLFHDSGKSDRKPGKTPTYKNAISIEWDFGVSALFLGTSEFPGDNERPAFLAARSKVFQGSICGIRLGDSIEDGMRKCGCKITSEEKRTSEISHIYAECQSERLEIISTAGKIDSVDMMRKDYDFRMVPKY